MPQRVRMRNRTSCTRRPPHPTVATKKKEGKKNGVEHSIYNNKYECVRADGGGVILLYYRRKNGLFFFPFSS